MRPSQRKLRKERLEKANKFLAAVGSHGRRFFCHGGVVSFIRMDGRGRLWFVDSWRGDETYMHYRGRWRLFHHGGTMKNLVKALRGYVMTGATLRRGALWWPDWYCDGDLWGYGKDEMEHVRAKALECRLVEAPCTR